MPRADVKCILKIRSVLSLLRKRGRESEQEGREGEKLARGRQICKHTGTVTMTGVGRKECWKTRVRVHLFSRVRREALPHKLVVKS